MLLSLLDAEYIKRSASVTARFLIFPLSGITIIYWILKPYMSNKLMWGTMGIVLFWAIDGLIQFSFGHDILGHPPTADGRLTGTFANWPHVGVILAIFLPVFLEGLYQLSLKTRFAWLLIFPVLSVILLSGGRSSWMLTIIALLGYFSYFYHVGRSIPLYKSILLVATISIFIVSIIWNVDWLSYRFNTTLGLFSDNYELIRKATSARTPIWSTAINMTKEHWINGVGPRSFQFLYDKYTIANDVLYLNEPPGHPHLFFLEISAETGVIGIMGYLIFFILFTKHIKAIKKSKYRSAIPWAISALVSAFPLSSTMSFYAYFSSSLFWTLAIIYLALSSPLTHHKSK